MPSHDLDNNDTSMTGRCSVQAVQRVHHDVNSGIETERSRCRFEVVVDSPRNTDAVDPGFLKLLRSHQRTIPSNDYQCSHPEIFQNLSGVPNNLDRHYSPIARADLGSEVAAIRRTENGASKRHNSVYSAPVENDVIARGKQTLKSIAKTDYFPTELVRSEH